MIVSLMSRSGGLGLASLDSVELGGCSGGAGRAPGGGCVDAGVDEVDAREGGATFVVGPPAVTVGDSEWVTGSGGREGTIVSLMSRTGTLGVDALVSGGLGGCTGGAAGGCTANGGGGCTAGAAGGTSAAVVAG